MFFPFVGKTIVPKVANEVKLISSGKILENNKTVGQCKMPFGDNAGGVIIMHVVVQPSLAKTKTGNFHSQIKSWCFDSIWRLLLYLPMALNLVRFHCMNLNLLLKNVFSSELNSYEYWRPLGDSSVWFYTLWCIFFGGGFMLIDWLVVVWVSSYALSWRRIL